MKPEEIKRAVENLQAEKTELQKRLNAVENSIKNMQTICSHKHFDGTDAMIQNVGIKYHYEECAYCGYKLDLR